jgi:hypothetical protein
VYRGAVAPIGFRRAGEEEIPRMMIVTSVSDSGAKAAKTAAGADAVIVNGKGLSLENIKQLAGILGEVPLGFAIEGSDCGDVAGIVEAGCDFVVFDIKTPLEVVNKEGLGRILKIDPTMDIGMVRAVSGFPLSIDGVLIGGENSGLTVERLLICQRFADLLDKPLLLASDSSITSSELTSLCEAGIKGIVVSSSITAKAIAELKKAISCMPKPTRRKEKAVPILPRISPAPEAVADEEEEEDI